MAKYNLYNIVILSYFNSTFKSSLARLKIFNFDSSLKLRKPVTISQHNKYMSLIKTIRKLTGYYFDTYHDKPCSRQ